MEVTPELMLVSNKDNFSKLYEESKYNLLRSAVFANMLLRDETDYFDLSSWSQANLHKKKRNLISNFTSNLMKELRDLGWTCNLSFNDTGLFIYADSSKPPKNYFPSTF